MSERQAAALLGFFVLGLSPSFVDWQEEPAKRPTMVAFYLVAGALIYFGVLAS